MNTVQKAIIPGILMISLLLVFLNQQVNPPLLAAAATEEPQKSATGQSSRQDNLAACEAIGRYPQETLQWCTLIESAASEYDVDPLLIAAVMLVESGGKPEVISHSGAVGLLQVMPRDGIASTFQCINGPCFANRPAIEEVKDPQFNVDFGTRMLAGLIDRTGSMREALKSYGPYDVGYDYADKVLSIYGSL